MNRVAAERFALENDIEIDEVMSFFKGMENELDR